jgi:hypothetical protein
MRPQRGEPFAVLSSRSNRRQIQRALFLGGILLVLGLGSARLLSPPTTASGNGRSSVVISEFMAAGQTPLADEDGEVHDWIELHNRGSQSVNLLGWSLTDDPAEPDKWMLPSVDLPPGGYLVIFASGKDRPRSTGGPKEIPPERLNPPSHLHTNFKLAAEGGYLALHDNTSRRILDAISFNYPEQREGMSYGACEALDSTCYMANPTPGAANDEANVWHGLAAPVTSNVPHGFYDALFEVELSTATPGAAIWYTTDGSEPAQGSGQVYTGPVPIRGTTVLRAVAVKPGYLTEPPVTFSYIFPDQVLRQPPDPPGYPATWGTYRGDLEGYSTGSPVPADYAMDPAVAEDPTYRDRMRDSLLSLPSLSLATGVENLDIYFEDTLARGIASERPVSVEWIDPAGADAGFQVDGGLRIQGHLGRSELIPKHSLRLLFRKAYGPGRLEYELYPGSPADSFDSLVLRAGNNESYAGDPATKTRLATYARDEWLRRTQLAPSGFGVRGRFVHLYLNGLYWGLYNLVERPDASFAASTFGGKEEEWVMAEPGGADTGILCRLDTMRRLAELGGMADPARYAAMLEFIDPVQFSDYLISHWYAGAHDWPENNWTIAMQQPDGPFLFITWDGELTWLDGAEVQLGVDAKQDRPFPNIIKPVFNALIRNPDFRMTLADRLHKLTSPGGVLSDDQARTRWMEITGELEAAIIAESARWGDTWFEPPVTPEDWAQGRDAVLDQMNGNSARLLAQARVQGYYPPIDPPDFSPNGTDFDDRMQLAMSASQGEIYYTLDGSDPRVPITGGVGPSAVKYVEPFELSSSTRVRARVMEAGVWSALNEADYVESSRPGGLRITELMYNPAGGDDYEFLELTNVGAFEVDLSGAAFEGIDLRFGRPTRLSGGSTMVLAADADAFRKRYPDVQVAAVYGGELSDRGETIVLRSATGEQLLSLTYDDEDGWPLTADGRGDSLVLVDVRSDANDPRSWQASSTLYGTPGAGSWAGAPWTDTLGQPAAVSAAAADWAAAGTATGLVPFRADSAQPSNASAVRLGDDMLLAGYDLYLNGGPLSPDGLPAVEPGDLLEVVLYWRRDRLAGHDAHGFVQMATPDGQILVQDDHPAGLVSRPSSDCSTPELEPDRYALRIPADAANGLVQPVVGGYVPSSGDRLPVYSSDGTGIGDAYGLPSLKIIRSGPAPTPQHEIKARIGEQINLLGYGLDPAETTLQPGQPLTVTLYFRTQAPVDEDLIRFVQLHSPEHGMAAQNDSQPAAGRNPTWAWKPGEVVVDEVVLTVAPDAAPGEYSLLLGFYRPADGARLAARDQAGNAAPDQILVLSGVTVLPAGGNSTGDTPGEGSESP